MKRILLMLIWMGLAAGAASCGANRENGAVSADPTDDMLKESTVTDQTETTRILPDTLGKTLSADSLRDAK